MSDWKNDVRGCFGQSDLIFAGHPADEDRAFRLLVRVRQENVGWAEVSAAFRAFLDRENAGSDHAAQQIAVIERRFRGWLLD
jgi:hypothetical protein